MSEETVGQIGRYKVLGELGRGGFGRVYRAYDASMGRTVAIKVLTQRGKEVLARFRNEAQVAGNLRHENIVTVYEYGEHEGQPFLAMEYLEGEDLQHILSSRKPLTLLEKCDIMSQVAEGLSCAHRSKVVHRDVKPANIMVRPDGVVKIMDFGIARITQDRDATRLTQDGWLIGTLNYMAPEQFSGAEIDALSDIFAFGVIYYELLTGRHPFEAPDSRMLMYKISFEEPAPIRDLVPECPKALERVILRTLSKDRELRYQSLQDVQFDTEIVRIELRKQRAAELLAQAQDHAENNQLDSAQSLILEVLSLDPSNRIARGLRENLQTRLHQIAIQPKIEALVSSAEVHFAQRRFLEAVQNLEAALKLDSENNAIQERIQQASAMLERNRAAESLLVEARKELDKHELTLAFRSVSEALLHDPQHPLATELHARIQTELERRQRERRIEEAVGRAEGLIVLHAYDEAIEILAALGPDADAPQVARLRSRLQTEKAEQARRNKLRAEMAIVTDLLRARRLEEAVERLEPLRIEYPEDQEVTHLLTYARKELETEARARKIKEIVEKTNALTESKNFNPALALVEETLKQFPGETALIRTLGSAMAAKAAWERQQAIDNTLRECAQLRAQQRFAEAIELVESTLRDYSSDPALVDLLAKLEEDWKGKRRADAVRKAADQAAQMLQRKQTVNAQQFIRQALAQYPGEPLLADLLKQADDELRAIEMARAIESILREASEFATAKNFGRALSALDQGLEKWPSHGDLLDRRNQIADAEAAWKRQKEIESFSERASTMAAGLDFGGALDLVRGALRTYPGEKELDQLEKRIARDWEQHKRREAVKGIASEIRLLLSRGRLDDAAEILNEGMAHYAGEPDLEALSAQVRDALRLRERTQAIDTLIRESQNLASDRRFDDARTALEKGLGAFPAEPAILRQLETVKTAAEAWRKEQAIAQGIAEAEGLAAALRFEDALKLLTRLGSSPALIETRRRIEGERDEHKRREAVNKGVADATALLQSGRPDAALKLLEDLSARYAGEPRWEPLLAQARTALAERQAAEERRKAIEKTIRDCDGLAAKGRFEEAFEPLARALRRYPDDPALLELRERLKAAWEKHKYDKEVGQEVAAANALLKAGRMDEAIASLRAACTKFPTAPSLGSLLAKTEKDLADRQEIQAALAEGNALLEQQRHEDAIRSLERSLARRPGNPELNSLAASARQQLDLQRREQAIAALTEEAGAFAKSRQFDRALQILERGLETWPREARLVDLQQSVQRDQQEWLREQSRRKILQDVRQLARQERYAEARERAETALKTFPDDPELLRLRSDARMREILDNAATTAAQGKVHDALRMVEDCSADYGSAPEWIALRDRLRDQVAASERMTAVQKKIEEAQALANRSEFDGAMKLLLAAAREWPDEPAIEDGRRAVQSAKQAHDRRLAIESAAAECVRLAEEGRLPEAIERLEKWLREFPKDSGLLQLRKRFQDESQTEKRRKQRQLDLDELRSLEGLIAEAANSARLTELRGVAERPVAQYPGDAEIRSAAEKPLGHLSDIESATAALLARNFDAALEISRRYLARFPQHVTFLSLQKDAERGRRAADLDAVRQRAERESNLAARAKILEEALARYPADAALTRDLEIAQNKLRLAETIVEAARAHEAAGAWDQALDQWNKLATIYERFPGLNGEIERVKAARERANAEAIAQRVAQIETLMKAGEFGKAQELLMRARTEFPEAGAFNDLDRRLTDLREKQRRVRDILGKLRALRERGKWDDFRARAAEAIQASADDSGLRKSVFEKLIENAQAVIDTEWRRAEEWISLIQSADSAYPVPEELLQSVAKRKREAAIESALTRSQELQTAGNRRGAVALLEETMRQFPDDARLQRVHKGINDALKKERAALFTELREVKLAAERAAQSTEIEPISARLAAVAPRVSEDAELAALVAEIERLIALRRKQFARARMVGVFSSHRKHFAIAGGVAAVLAAALLVVPPFLKSRRSVSVTVTSNADGASVSVGGVQCITPKCVLDLRPGNYTLTATKDGFHAITQPLEISQGTPELKAPLTFEPLPEELRINTNFESGNVYLDDKPAAPLHGSQFTASGLGPGPHNIRVTGGDGEFQAEWQSTAGAPPTLATPISAKDVQAAVVANAGGSGTIACNCGTGPVLVDGQPAGQTASNTATPLAQLREGSRQIAVGGRSIVVDIQPNPTLSIFLALDRNVGTFIINAGVDDAKVYLNNRLSPQRTEHGIARIPAPVGEYSIRIEKDGLRPVPAQTASLGKGEEKQITFALSPTQAALEIKGTQPQASVKVDSHLIGQTDASGSFRAEVAVGTHAIELSKEGYTSAKFELKFVAGGAPVRPTAAQVAMTKTPASSPAGPTAPAVPKTVDTEPQDWARVANSQKTQDFDDYLRRHPGGAHEADARSHISQLQQALQQSEAAARDQADWNAVDKNNAAALQDFLSRHGASPHAQEARGLIDTIQRREAADAAAAADQRKKTDQARAADIQAVKQTLIDFEAAYNRMDSAAIKRVYDSLPEATIKQLKDTKSITFHIMPSEQPVVTGDTATVVCTRSSAFVAKSGGLFNPGRARPS